MKTSIKALTVGTIAAIGFAFAGSASAATPWERHQEHRAQIHRHIQDKRIDHAQRTGQINHWQARQLHRENHRGYYHRDHRGYYNHGYHGYRSQRGYNYPQP